MYFIGILRGAAMARFISVAWPHCSCLLLLHQTAFTGEEGGGGPGGDADLGPKHHLVRRSGMSPVR
jgi:hypothetical protein